MQERHIEEDVRIRRDLHRSSQRHAAVETSMEEGEGADAQAAGRQ